MTKEKRLFPGKLPIKILDRLLKRYIPKDESLVVPPSIGIDAAVLKIGDRYLIAKTDPITFVASDIGFYTININANDIAVMGGRPRWFLATLLLPEASTTESMVESIFSQLSKACNRIGATLCGGHTEITFGIDRPLVVGQMLGEVDREKLVTAGGARIGDDIVLTKGIAIEGTSIIARERGVELISQFGGRFIKRCIEYTKKPGISVLRDAHLAVKQGGITAMHDPTEGGLATGLYELAMASDVGLIVKREHIPVLPECRRLCDYFRLDPLGLIASGALIAVVDPEYTQGVLTSLNKNGIDAVVIGRIVSKRSGIKIKIDKRVSLLRPFERDEITRII